MFTCPRCGGDGTLPMFIHIDNGICFMCDGIGKVDNVISTIDINDESCTAIHYLKKSVNATQYIIACFYTWADDGRKYANTGHHYIQLIDTERYEEDEYYGHDGLDYHRTTMVESKCHNPINIERAAYKALLVDGYAAVEYSESLFAVV